MLLNFARTSAQFTFLLVAIGFVARVPHAFLILEPSRVGDSVYYLTLAESLRADGSYSLFGKPDFYRPPLYPLFLAGVSFLPGDWLRNIIVVQAALSMLAAICFYLMLRRKDEWLARWSAILFVASPFTGINDFSILQESLYTNVVLLLVMYVFSRAGGFGWPQAISASLLSALLVYVRDIYMLMPIALMAMLVLVRGRAVVGPAALAIVVFAASLAPWMARNASIPGGGYFMSRGIAGASLWFGTWQRDNKWRQEWLRGQELPDHAFANEAERQRIARAIAEADDRGFRQLAVERIRDRPAEIALVWFSRMRYVWLGTRSDLVRLRLETGSWPWYVLKAALYGLNTAVLLAGFIGLAFLLAAGGPWPLLTVPVVYVLLIYVPFLNIEARYSSPALPFLYLAGLFAFRETRRWWRARTRRGATSRAGGDPSTSASTPRLVD